MFHQGCKCILRGAEGKCPRKRYDIATFTACAVKFETLQMQKQGSPKRLHVECLLHKTCACATNVIVVCCEKLWHFEIAKQSLQDPWPNRHGNVRSWVSRRMCMPGATRFCTSQRRLDLHSEKLGHPPGETRLMCTSTVHVVLSIEKQAECLVRVLLLAKNKFSPQRVCRDNVAKSIPGAVRSAKKL